MRSLRGSHLVERRVLRHPFGLAPHLAVALIDRLEAAMQPLIGTGFEMPRERPQELCRTAA
jgi:hypothetical protein